MFFFSRWHFFGLLFPGSSHVDGFGRIAFEDNRDQLRAGRVGTQATQHVLHGVFQHTWAPTKKKTVHCLIVYCYNIFIVVTLVVCYFYCFLLFVYCCLPLCLLLQRCAVFFLAVAKPLSVAVKFSAKPKRRSSSKFTSLQFGAGLCKEKPMEQTITKTMAEK